MAAPTRRPPTATNGDTGDMDELDPLEVAVYRAALSRPFNTVGQLAHAVSRDASELDKALRRLSELGLLRLDDDLEQVVAVSPMLAEATVLGGEDLDLGVRRASVESRRNAIRRLVIDWNETLASSRVGDGAVDVISDPAQIGNVLMHYADRCQDELLSVSPGRMPKTRLDSRARIANLYSVRRGVRSRLLYQHAALRDRQTRIHLGELTDSGARIRLAASVPGRSLVIDREVALLALPGDDQNAALAIVREPHVLAWVIAGFEQLWAESQPLGDALSRQNDDAGVDQTRVAILRLMAEGEKDEAISRRLSISVRTCRRQIADYMALVGASSRFQAGVIAARAGHLEASGPG